MRFLPNAFPSRPSRFSPLCTVIGCTADFALCRLAAHSEPMQCLQSCLNKQRSDLLAAAAAAAGKPLDKYAGCWMSDLFGSYQKSEGLGLETA
jgi:hypothetical protein